MRVVPFFAAILTAATLCGCANWQRSRPADAGSEKDETLYAKGGVEALAAVARAEGASVELPDSSNVHSAWILPIPGVRAKRLWVSPPESEIRALLILTEGNDLIAVRRGNGQALWWLQLGEEPIGPPAYTPYSIYVVVKGALLCIDRNSGDVLWRDRLDFPPTPYLDVQETRIGEPFIFMAAINRVLYAMDVRKTVWPPKAGYGSITRKDLMLERHELNIRWRFPTRGVIEGPIAFKDGFLFAADAERRVYCLNTLNVNIGRPKLAWNTITRGPNGSGVLVRENYVFVASRDRNLYCYSRSSGGEIWRYESGGILTETPVYLKDPVTGAESVCQRGGDGDLFCLDAARGTKRWEIDSGGVIAALDDDPEKPDERRASVVVAHPDGSATALQFHSGEVLWQLPAGTLSATPQNPWEPGFYTLSADGAAIVALRRR
jgi:outer membrane protein assembly factor BamB